MHPDCILTFILGLFVPTVRLTVLPVKGLCYWVIYFFIVTSNTIPIRQQSAPSTW